MGTLEEPLESHKTLGSQRRIVFDFSFISLDFSFQDNGGARFSFKASSEAAQNGIYEKEAFVKVCLSSGTMRRSHHTCLSLAECWVMLVRCSVRFQVQPRLMVTHGL